MLWSFVSFLGVSIELIWNILFVQVLLNGSIVLKISVLLTGVYKQMFSDKAWGQKRVFSTSIVDWIPITLLMYGRKITERERGERISCTLFVYENRTSKERERTMERWLGLKPWYFDEPSKT